MTNSKRLRARMLEAGFSQRTLASEIKMSVNTLNRKINNKRSFNCDEVDAICEALHIDDPEEMANIFLSKPSQ